ncbi:MAG: hypothetical protein IPP47_33265 [Bryobacterales bacterium]|nr:hypothetical protein [Bryobacterales bacterium]
MMAPAQLRKRVQSYSETRRRFGPPHRARILGPPSTYREDDPDCIVRLIGQVIAVSIETNRIVRELGELPFRED